MIFKPLVGRQPFKSQSRSTRITDKGQESRLHTLFEAIGINRLAKIGNVAGIIGFFGGCSHTDMGGVLEIFQNSTPASESSFAEPR